MKVRPLLALFGATSMLGACQILPRFDDSPAVPERVVPRVSDIVGEIQCEIVRTFVNNRNLKTLQTDQYVVAVNLTLEVTNNQGVNATLSFLDPSGLGANFIVGPQAAGTQHRTFQLTYTQLLDLPSSLRLSQENCATDRFGLRGNLGIETIMLTGLGYTAHNSGDPESPYKMHVLGMTKEPASLANPLTNDDTLAPAFATQIDFTLVYGLGGGPNWSLATFSGPNPNGLLSLLRTNKDTLILSFARVVQPEAPTAAPTTKAAETVVPDPRAAARRSAGRAAQDNLTRLLIQRLLPIR